MVQKAATINNATDSSKKCFHCGLTNFAETNRCKRCKSDLSLPLKATKNDIQMPGRSAEVGQSSFSFTWILTALVVVLLGLVFFYMRQGPKGAPEVRPEAV